MKKLLVFVLLFLSIKVLVSAYDIIGESIIYISNRDNYEQFQFDEYSVLQHPEFLEKLWVENGTLKPLPENNSYYRKFHQDFYDGDLKVSRMKGIVDNSQDPKWLFQVIIYPRMGKQIINVYYMALSER